MKHKTILATAIALALIVVAGAAAVYSGRYNVAADDPHTRPVLALIETARERSIAVRAADLEVPADLGDPKRIRQGAGNYNAMCTGCHLTPGSDGTELSRGLYPTPPNLSRQRVAPAEAFWVIKHGIKASGMPAWGKSMEDEYIWNMAAFLQELPNLDKAGYDALVASSGGHSHGGGETVGHAHADGDEAGDESRMDHHGAGANHHDSASTAKGEPAAAAGIPEATTGHTHTHDKEQTPAASRTEPATASKAHDSGEHAHTPEPEARPTEGNDDGHEHHH